MRDEGNSSYLCICLRSCAWEKWPKRFSENFRIRHLHVAMIKGIICVIVCYILHHSHMEIMNSMTTTESLQLVLSCKACLGTESGFSMFSIIAEILKITLHIDCSLALLMFYWVIPCQVFYWPCGHRLRFASFSYNYLSRARRGSSTDIVEAVRAVVCPAGFVREICPGIYRENRSILGHIVPDSYYFYWNK